MALLGRLVCLVLLLVSSASAAQDVRGGVAPPGQLNRIGAQISHQPMTFFVVRGAADSCGSGCNRWIVAEGRFEADTGQRFKDFIGTTSRRNLPVFFHSPGGNLAAAIDLAASLRDHRMTAAIGRTIPDGCNPFGRGNASCQGQMDAGRELRGKLQESAGVCLSGCVYAFAGASTRRVHPTAILGVHLGRLDQQAVRKLNAQDAAKAKQLKITDVHKGLRLYLLQWGIDPDLEDIAEKVAPSRIYILSRAEIARLGLETHDFFETRWLFFGEAPALPTIRKAITHLTGKNPREHGTVQFIMRCWKSSEVLTLEYQRELPIIAPLTWLPSVSRISAGDVTRPFQTYSSARREMGWMTIDDAFQKAATAPKITRFELTFGNAGTSQLIDVSNAGFSESLVALQKRCSRVS